MEKKQKNETEIFKSYGYDILAFVLSVILACFIWGYVMSVESPESEQTFSGVHVEVNNIDKMNNNAALSVISESDGINVSFVLKGKKSLLSQISPDDIRAYVDVGTITSAGTYDLEVVYLPIAGATVVNIFPKKVTVNIDSTGTISVPISVKFDDCHVPSGYSTGDYLLNAGSVQVSGAMADLEKIKEAVITLKTTGTLTSSMTFMNEVPVLCDKNGNPFTSDYITYPKVYVDVFVPVYLTREITLAVDTVYGYYNSKNTDITVDPAKITVTGDASVIAALPDIYVIGTVDEKLPSDTYLFPIDFSKFSPDITIVSGEKKASVSIAHKGTDVIEMTYSADNFTVNNPADIAYNFTDGYVGLTLKYRVDSDALGYLDDGNVEAILDLSSINTVQGSSYAPLRIVFKNSLEGKAYEIGEYTVPIILGTAGVYE